MKDTVLKVEVVPVGIDKENPNRFDIFVKRVNGGYCGYSVSKSQAESWAEGIQIALNEQHKITKHGLNRD